LSLLVWFQSWPQHTTAATVLKIEIVNAIDSKLYCASLFIDLLKAFDTVNHYILLEKLDSFCFENISLKCFQSYLHCRTQSLNVAGVTSAALEIKIGVPQGSWPTVFYTVHKLYLYPIRAV
jgi:hypothetical protein